MNTNLKTTPNPNSVEAAVGFKSSVQSLNGRSAVVNHLPFGGFDSSSKCLPMAWIRVNDGFSAVLPL